MTWSSIATLFLHEITSSLSLMLRGQLFFILLNLNTLVHNLSKIRELSLEMYVKERELYFPIYKKKYLCFLF